MRAITIRVTTLDEKEAIAYASKFVPEDFTVDKTKTEFVKGQRLVRFHAKKKVEKKTDK